MRLVSLLAALLMVATPRAAARAQGNAVEDARTAYDAGASEYDLGHYQDALQLFEKAFRLKHVPALLFNIAQCHRMLGELKEAAKVYRSFIAKDPSNRGVPQARELLAQVEQALEKSAQAQNASPTGVTPAAEAKPAPAAAPEAKPLAPGPVLVLRAEPARPAPSAAPRAAVQTSAPVPAPAAHRRVWTWVAAGGAVAAVGLGAGFGAKSKSTQSSLSGSVHPGAEVPGLQDSQMSDAHRANALFVAGGVLAAASALLFVLEL